MKIARLAPILPALILAACQSAPAPVATVAPPPPRATARGIDLATETGNFLGEIKNNGVDFVARYYRTPDSRWPSLTAAEAQQLSALGVKIVAVWESHSHKPQYFSYSTGYGDAVTAYGEAQAVGQPAGSAIYFAVDFDAKPEALASIDDYFRGVAAGMAAAGVGRPQYKVGVYGSGVVCQALRQAGLAQYSWLSNSIHWAGSGDYTAWNIRQGDPLAELTFSHDSDEAKAEDYGGFRLAGATLAAAAQPAPAAQPAVAAQTVAAGSAAPAAAAATPEVVARRPSTPGEWLSSALTPSL